MHLKKNCAEINGVLCCLRVFLSPLICAQFVFWDASLPTRQTFNPFTCISRLTKVLHRKLRQISWEVTTCRLSPCFLFLCSLPLPQRTTLSVLHNSEHRPKTSNRQLILQHISAPLPSLVRLSLHPFSWYSSLLPMLKASNMLSATCRFSHPHKKAYSTLFIYTAGWPHYFCNKISITSPVFRNLAQ